MEKSNQIIILDELKTGEVTASDFRLIEKEIPEIHAGEVLLKAIYISLDPYTKKILRPQAAYADIQNTKASDAIASSSVCIVEESKNPNLQKGELVLAYTGWQQYAVSKGNLIQGLPWDINNVKKISPTLKSSYYLSVLGMTGLTAYGGLVYVGQPKAGETVVVTAATGAVGSIVGQLAKTFGCRVVGVVGSDEKCQLAVDELGFDACVNYKKASFSEDLKKACPQKIDVYYDNVGGDVFYKILEHMNDFSRVALCGSMAWTQQNSDPIPMGPDLLALIYFAKIPKRIKFQSFIVIDYMDQYDEVIQRLSSLIEAGKIKVIEDVREGLEKTPEAYIGLLNGNNKGKLIVKL